MGLIYIYIFLLFLKTKNYRNYNQVGKSRYIYHSRGLFVCFLFLGSKLDTAWREREFVKTTMTEGDVKCGGFLAEV